MATHMISLFYSFFLAWVALNGFIISSTEGAEVESCINPTLPFNRTSFPDGFIFGAGSAAYQVEGAANIDGRGPSIWDNFTREHPEKIADHSNGDVAADFYHRYRKDINIMKEMGLDSFRFSISWSRLFPNGKISARPNPQGLRFYNDLINKIISKGMKPFVTLLHFDSPQALEDRYGGLLNHSIVEDFKAYADFCFKTFGNRVKLWVTMNEPNLWSIYGYNDGIFAPGRCSSYVGNCSVGDSATEPYIAAHNLLLAHAAAVKLYKDNYQAHQKGQIGITIMTHWFVPKWPTATCWNAASRALDFLFGWFAHPVIYGDYPQIMKSSVGNRLPRFTPKESKLLKGSLDFLGLNYYTAYYAEPALLSSYITNRHATVARNRRPKLSEMQSELLEGSIEFLGLNDDIANYSDYYRDRGVKVTSERNGIPIGTPTDLNWLFIYPKGLHDLLLYVQYHYKNPPVIITENGFADASNKSFNRTVGDTARICYIKSHLSNLLEAIKEGVNMKGYYIWSHLDVFEWNSGYTVRFGLIFVDYKNNLKRHYKHSARWLKKFLLK